MSGPGNDLADDQAGERGSVTVEAAVAIGAIVVALWLGLAGVMAAADHVRCLDAAREAARLAARGEVDRAQVVAAGIAPRGAAITVHTEGDTVFVSVHSANAVLPITVHGDAYAVVEP